MTRIVVDKSTDHDLLFTTISKITKEIFVKIFWRLKTPTPTWKCTRCIMYTSDVIFHKRVRWKYEAAGGVLLLFSSVWNPDKIRSTSFWNYFSNKRKLVWIIIWISFLNSTIIFETWNMHEAQKKCVWCAWFYHLIAALWQFLNIQQLRSRYLAVCQFRTNTLLRNANGKVHI